MFLGAELSAELSLHLEVRLGDDWSLPGLLGVPGHVPVGGPGGGAPREPRVLSAGPVGSLRAGGDGTGLAGAPAPLSEVLPALGPGQERPLHRPARGDGARPVPPARPGGGDLPGQVSGDYWTLHWVWRLLPHVVGGEVVTVGD